MSIGKTTLRVLGCGLALTALGGLSGCGGGGGDGSAPQALTLSSVSAQTPAPGGGVQTVTSSALLVGQKPVTGPTVYEAYPTDPANPGIPNGVPIPNPPGNAQLSVAPPVFSIPGGGVQSFLELDFGTMVRASTIKSAAGGIQDGITLFWIQGATPPTQDNGVVRLLVDTTGVIDPSNVVTDDKAPARLRLYYSADGSLATPDALPVGDYLLRINANLLSSDGLGLVNGNTSSGVASGIAKLMPSWGFSIGPNATALDWAGPAEGVTVSGISANNATGVPVNSEIVLNFADAVDFPSLVGGANNLTTRDPFISVPFLPFLPGANGVYEGGGGDDTPATNGNVPFTYGLPTDVSTGVLQPLPLNLGYVVYMPDPRLNPTQVRIRFVDVSTLVGIENTVIGQFQNYASNPDKFPIRSSNPALLNLTTGLTPLLTLPAASVVPGSYRNALNQVGNSVLTLNILAGATDRAANGALPRTVAFTWAVGPALARNPVSGDAVYIGIQTGGAPPEDKPGVGVVDTAALNGQPNVGCSQIPTAFGGLLGGNMSFRPNRLANPAVLGQPLDIDVGLTLNLGYPFPDAPRGGLVPGVPDGQNTVGPLGIFLCVGLSLAPPPQPYGNRLYVIDGTSSEVKVFNSYDFSLITTIPGVASPAGLGTSPTMLSMYVSNGNQGTVQRIDTNPNSPFFHQVTGTVTVGPGPRAVTVCPTNEDVFVANFNDNSVSIIRTSTFAERLRLAVGMGPSEIIATNRMLGMGLTNEYQAFITNFFSNTVTMYESAGGAELTNLPEGRVMATGTGFLGPKYGGWNWQTYIGFTSEPGMLVANSAGTTVQEYTMFFFIIGPPPGFPGLPTRRDMHVFRSYNAGTLAPSVGPSDALMDMTTALGQNSGANKSTADIAASGGVPTAMLVSFPGAGRVVAFDYATSAPLSFVSTPGCDFMTNYYGQ